MTKCRISHPEHLVDVHSTSFGQDGQKTHMFCKACNSAFVKASTNLDDFSDGVIVQGPKHCYDGKHQVKPLKSDDMRKSFDSLVVMYESGEELQRRINSLNGNEKVRTLVIKSGSGYYDDSSKPNLNVRLPNLEELQVHDVGIGKLVLTNDTTPNLRKIWMQNPTESEEPDFKILCPELRDISIFYWGPGDFEWLINMLETATKLECFDSYKLRVGYLKFASNHLRHIRLHRPELLERIDLWAPRLEVLNVQAAYDLSEIHFLETHEIEKELPSNFRFHQELHVDSTNALLGEQAIESILAHPRFSGERSDLESDFD